MQCTKPVFLQGTGYVPCGKCTACRIMRTREWSVRIIHELDSWEHAVFVTLTYNDDYLPSDFSLKKRDLQLFFKRLRKSVSPLKIKYFACGEYGEKFNRPHYHAIIFGMALNDARIKEVWKWGFIRCGTVTPESARYVAGYIQKKYSGKLGKEVYGDKEAPFQLQSQGIGFDWMEANSDYLVRNIGLTMRGVKFSLPRYYRKKLGDRISRERLEVKMLEAGVARQESMYKQGVNVLMEWKHVSDLREQKTRELDAKQASYKPRSF